MTTFDNRAYLRVGSKTAWVRPPDNGLEMSPKTWGSTTQLINGSNGVVGSANYARTYTLSWNLIWGDDFRTLFNLLSTAGNQRVYYMDKFSISESCLSPLAGKPYLLAETMSPVAYDDTGKVLARVVNETSLQFDAVTAGDGKPHEYVENIQLPKGWRLNIVARGVNTERAVSVSGSGLVSGQTLAINGDADKEIPLRIAGNGTASRVDEITCFMTPGTGVANTAWKMPTGTTEMRVVPGSMSVTGVNAATGAYSMSVEVTEVWPWL